MMTTSENDQQDEMEAVFFFAGADWVSILDSVGKDHFRKLVKKNFPEIYIAIVYRDISWDD